MSSNNKPTTHNKTMKTQYVIRADRKFYGPQTKSELIVRDYERRAIKFDSREDAKQFVSILDESAYYTAHNESGRPDYSIIPVSRVPKFLNWSLQ